VKKRCSCVCVLNVVYLLIIQSVNVQYARGCCTLVCVCVCVCVYFAIRSYARIALIADYVLSFKLSAGVYGQ